MAGRTRNRSQRGKAPRRRRRSTTEAGLGYEHQKIGRDLRAMFRDGDLCPFARTGQCKYPGGRMYSHQALQVDDFPPRALGGGAPEDKRLAHARCNEAAGGRLGGLLRRRRAVIIVRRKGRRDWGISDGQATG